MTTLPLRIGVLLIGTIQLLDLATIDLLYMTSPTYLTSLSLPQTLVSMGRPCEFHYISSSIHNSTANPDTNKTTTTTTTTSQLTITLTDHTTDPAVAAGNLDIIVIPGPSPISVAPSDADLDFVRSHNAANTSILSICTGAYVIGYAGIAEGKQITGPRPLVPELRRRFPGPRWDDGVRFVRDGNLWSSGGITNGHDLVAMFLREHYPAQLVDTILLAADITERAAKYTSSASPSTNEEGNILDDSAESD
ncbi:hypothetical protein N7461_003561 [Penicillium sp. DV-2018c]|nr:hypothetical protein N7461_003561 [Penicillium sp. DV-2018c]